MIYPLTFNDYVTNELNEENDDVIEYDDYSIVVEIDYTSQE